MGSLVPALTFRRSGGGANVDAPSRAVGRGLLLAVFVIATTADWLRLPRTAWDTFYAEDGRTFVGDWADHPSSTLFFQPYAGYQHFLPRVITFLTTQLTPVSAWANVDSILACAVVGGVATLVLALSEDVVHSRTARCGLAAIPVLLPIARFEAVGNVANLHWYMLYLMPWLFLAVPRTRVGAAGLGLVAAAAVMTEPQCAIYFPLAAVLWFRQRESRATIVGWSIGLAGQAVTYFAYAGIRPSHLTDLASSVKGFVINAVATDALPEGARLGPIIVRLGWWTTAVAGAAVLVLALLVYVYGQGHLRTAVVVVVAAAGATWCASFFLNDHSAFDYDTMSAARLSVMPFVRWGTGAAMLLSAVVPLAADVVISRSNRSKFVGTAMVGTLVLVMCVWFARGDTTRGGPHWNDGLRAAAPSCRLNPAGRSLSRFVSIPSYPAGWVISLPCDDELRADR